MARKKTMWSDYYEWLCNRYNIYKRGYENLLEDLINTPFVVILERDSNRLADGAALRDIYFLENGISGSFLDREISVLEVLLALSARIDNEYVGSPNDPRPDIIFWDFMSNLGLSKYDNAHYNVRKVDEILRIWMLRTYRYDGLGGLFPLKNPKNDQKKVELWDQTMAYLTENYI